MAAIVIKLGGPVTVDAIASFVVAAILVFSAFRVVRDATLVLLEAAPLHLPVGAVREVILAFAGIAEVHDLHVWTLGAGHDAITAHVRASDGGATLARRLSLALREAFETEYVTVQVEGRRRGKRSEAVHGRRGAAVARLVPLLRRHVQTLPMQSSPAGHWLFCLHCGLASAALAQNPAGEQTSIRASMSAHCWLVVQVYWQ